MGLGKAQDGPGEFFEPQDIQQEGADKGQQVDRTPAAEEGTAHRTETQYQDIAEQMMREVLACGQKQRVAYPPSSDRMATSTSSSRTA